MGSKNHKLYLGMYSFQIKKNFTRNTESVDINDFLSDAYPDAKNKFSDGFSQEIINLFDAKTFKNKGKTHGGTLEESSIASEKRYFDILIDGGLTGIRQFIVNEDGTKSTISADKTIGLKFYARFWLPAGNKTGYVFIQKYGALSIKPLFDEIIKVTLKNHGYKISNPGNRMHAITTKKRLEKFLKSSTVRDVTVISKQSKHETGAGDAQSVIIKLRNIAVNKKDKKIDQSVIKDALKNHSLKLGKSGKYDMSLTYVSKQASGTEERTAKLEQSTEEINIIPNILIPEKCIDSDRYPIFNEVKEFTDKEIKQILKESRE